MNKELLIEVADPSYSGIYDTCFMLFTNLDYSTKQFAYKLGTARRGLRESIDIYVRDSSYIHELEAQFENVCELLRQNESQIKFLDGQQTDCFACDAPITLSRSNQKHYNNLKKAKYCIISGMIICSIICWWVFAGILLVPTSFAYLFISLIICIIIIGWFLPSLGEV